VFCVFCGKEFSSLILAVQLPGEEVEFLEARAKKHATSVAEIFTRYARRLQNTTGRTPHPETLKFTGSVNADVDAREAASQQFVHSAWREQNRFQPRLQGIEPAPLRPSFPLSEFLLFPFRPPAAPIVLRDSEEPRPSARLPSA